MSHTIADAVYWVPVNPAGYPGINCVGNSVQEAVEKFVNANGRTPALYGDAARAVFDAQDVWRIVPVRLVPVEDA